nr:DUF3869 domain-containing protein [uncultured Bacteroides sp.]
MKMKGKVFGYSAKLALAVLAVFGTFTSCYEKESVDITTVVPAVYYVVGTISDGSNGQPIGTATVKVDGTAVSLNNGAFIQKVAAAGAHTVDVSATGYYDVKKTVFCVEVADGQTSTALADIALFTPSSQASDPVQTPTSPSTANIEAVKGQLVTSFTPTSAPAGTTMGTTTAVVNNDGTVTVSTPLTLASPSVDPVTVTYSYKEGFALVGEPAIVTKAVSEKDQIIANIANYLNKSYGLKEVSRTALLDGGTNSVIGYKVTYTVNIKTFIFTVSGNNWSADATWLSNVQVTAVVDTHDSHNTHGGSTNAGGGAGGAE